MSTVSPPLCPYSNPGFKYGVDAFVKEVREGKNAQVRDFWRLLALCHTVVVETEDNTDDSSAGGALGAGEVKTPEYNAQSPDEAALVAAARDFGFAFHTRNTTSITINELGKDVTYEFLNVLEFNSDRKRMSVVVRDPNSREILLLTKGADDKVQHRSFLEPSILTNVVGCVCGRFWDYLRRVKLRQMWCGRHDLI